MLLGSREKGIEFLSNLRLVRLYQPIQFTKVHYPDVLDVPVANIHNVLFGK